MNSLSRLLWALPLVLAVGAGAMMLLRRIVVPPTRAKGVAPRLVSRETLSLSEQTRVHLFEVEGSSYIILESTQSATLQLLPVQALETSRAPARLQPAWLRRMAGGTR
jgi:hypothetical protein